MKNFDYEILLNEWRNLPSENELVEFKEAKENFDSRSLGKYFSALSNEANLKGKDFGWLIFGVAVNNKTFKVVGTNYRNNRASLDNLKHEIAQQTGGSSFVEIHELPLPEGRIIIFQIPAALHGIPTAHGGHYYGRNGESLVALSLEKIERIRKQGITYDWSADFCDEATLDDLDPDAIDYARLKFKEKNPNLSQEIDKWDDLIFLNKAKLMKNGKITRTAIILLGRDESSHYLSPSVAHMTWILKGENGMEKDYEHFGPPFLLNTDKLLNKIRNLNYRYMPSQNTLFPVEITQYDNTVLREALHNCIAHQDYELTGRINVVEKPDELFFSNLGDFLPRSVENVIETDSPPELYRNQFLVQAMLNLNMIDTMGSGIKRMFETQMERYFPLPDYDLTTPERVVVKIFGKVLDINYTRALIENTQLDLTDVMLLDRVQKNQKISKNEAKQLRSLDLIEGRFPNLYVSSSVAKITGDMGDYIKNRAFDDDYYRDMIISFIKEYGKASRKEIDALLLDKLSAVLSKDQKKKKISNLLHRMNDKKKIMNVGSKKQPIWVLFEFSKN